MAIYRAGSAAMAANGVITGKGTKWQTALSLIRVGSTIVFLRDEIKLATISAIVSDTEMRAVDTDGQAIADGPYALLLSDSLTVDGLAQDIAETLRYYQGQETAIADLTSKIQDYVTASSNSAKASSDSAAAAKTSETNAGAKANDAAGSATAAANSASAAKTSETNAGTQATNAANSAKAASDSAKAASDSAASAKTSADNAAASAAGSVKLDGSSRMTGELYAPGIDLVRDTPFIDFHYGRSTDDYTVRIINDTNSYTLRVLAPTASGWGSIRSGSLRSYGGVLGVTDDGTNTFDFSVNAGILQLARSGTGGFNLSGIPVLNAGTLAFVNSASARQSLLNMGVSRTTGPSLLIPISTTQAVCIQSVNTVVALNINGDATVVFPRAFASIDSITANSGDFDAFAGSVSLNAVGSGTSFNIRCRKSDGSIQNSNIRLIYTACGIVNL